MTNNVIGYHIQDNEVVNSDGELCRDGYLDFLLKDKGRIKVFYNLDWAIARLVYLLELPDDIIKTLWKTGDAFYQGIKFFYVPHRYLGLKYGQHWGEAGFSHIYQYDADLPMEIDALAAAQAAAEIGEQVYSALAKIGLKPATLSSPVSSFQKQILSTHDLPTYEDCPAEATEYAFNCCVGGWLEAYKKGHWANTWDYDITSAYPYQAANLLDTRFGQWFKSENFHSKADYGFLRGTIRIDTDFSPITYNVNYKGDSLALHPKGELPTFITLDKVKFMYDYGIGEFNIIDGWYWFANERVKPMYENYMRLFEWKNILSGFEKDVIKRISNGSWGKLLEIFKDGSPGQLFNPVWGAYVESGTRLQVAALIMDNNAENDILSIAVDGAIFNREIPIIDNGNMGDWKLTAQCPAYIVASGAVAVKDKEVKGDFALKYSWLDQEIRNNPGANTYTMYKTIPVTMGAAIKNNDFSRLGTLEKQSRKLDVRQEAKRLYLQRPQCGGDLLKHKYDSVPLCSSMANYIEIQGTN